MKPADVKTCTYINFDVEQAHRNPKFDINDHVRISINKNTFAKGVIPKWSEEFFKIKSVKGTTPWTCVNEYVLVEKLLERFVKMIAERKTSKQT